MLAIAGGKGGCGKTTTTLGIAAALARAGRRVVAIDADRDMPDLHVAAGVPGEPTAAAVADGTPPESVLRPVPGRPRVGVVPAAPGVSRSAIRTAIARCRALDAVGLVDCPAGAGPGAVDPIRVADRVVVVTTGRPAGVRDAAKTARIAASLDTPVAAVVVAGTDSPPPAVGRHFDPDPIVTGAVAEPLSAAGARAHRELVASVWQELFSGSPT